MDIEEPAVPTPDEVMFESALERASRLAERHTLEAEALAPLTAAIGEDEAAARAARALGETRILPPSPPRTVFAPFLPPYPLSREGPTEGSGAHARSSPTDGKILLDLSGQPSGSGPWGRITLASAALGIATEPNLAVFAEVRPRLEYNLSWKIATLMAPATCGCAFGVLIEEDGGQVVGTQPEEGIVLTEQMSAHGHQGGRWDDGRARFLTQKHNSYKIWLWANLWGATSGGGSWFTPEVEAHLEVDLFAIELGFVGGAP